MAGEMLSYTGYRTKVRTYYQDEYIAFIQQLLFNPVIMNCVLTINKHQIKSWYHCTQHLSILRSDRHVVSGGKPVSVIQYRVHFKDEHIATINVRVNDDTSVGKYCLVMEYLDTDDQGFIRA